MNNNYRFQLRHGDEAKNFVTRHDVFKHINGQLQYGGVSLLPYEPVLFYYGEEGDKNAIIMVGLPEGETHHDKSYFIIDTAELKAQIEALDTKYDDAIKSLQEEDGKLWDAINKEVEDRIAADEAEAQARSEKDAELESAIADETEARIAADEAEAQARSEKDAELESAIADEAEARAKADELLQEAIDFTKADLMSIVDACGLIYNDKMSEGRVSYEPDSHDEVIRDSRDVADAIDRISKFAAKLGKDLQIAVANTETVNLTITPNEKDGGSVITADVNIAETDGKSKEIFDNNIIGKTSEGIYASVSLTPSKKSPNKLIFKTSGYVDGKFVVDAFETEVDLFTYNGDSGKNTGVNVIVDNEKNLISAELILSSDKNNILKLEDGEYVVEGVAKNIKYGETTVAGALKNQANRITEIEDEIDYVKAIEVKGSETSTSVVNVEKSTKGDFTVSNDVKLSNDRSIIIANGGLKANVSASFREGTSTLIITVGDNEYSINLSALAVSVLEKAEYDSVTEEIVLTFRVGDSLKTLRIPVSSLIHDMEVDDTDTIDLTLTSVSGGPNRLSAVLKVDKAHGDNILTVNSNGAYVSKSFITEAVKEESDARKDADKELKNKLDEVSTLANTNKEAIAEEANVARAAEKANANAIAQEIKDARAAEKANADAIANNEAAISDNTKAISAEVTRATKAEEANADAIIAEENRAKAAEVKNENAIASEIDRATEKEADLLNEISNSNVKIKENKDAITAEVDRATKAEKTLTDSVSKNASDIASETLRATAAEETNATAITTETNRAKTAESELAADVAKNATAINEVKAMAEKNKTDLATEITRATAAEKSNTDAIANEASRATTAEEAINTKVTKNINDIESAKSDITAEATRAAAAEAELTTKLTDEVTRAKAAENANATAITNVTEVASDAKSIAEQVKTDLAVETSRSINKDNELNSLINSATIISNNALNKTVVVEAKVNELNATLISEITRSTGKDTELENAIANANSAIATKADAVNVFTKAETLDKLAPYAKTADVNTELANKLNVTDAANVYATKTALEEVKDASATKEEVNVELSKKLNTTEAANVYATKTALEEVKDASATKEEVNTKLANKLNVTDAANVYATKVDVQNVKDSYATVEYVNQLNTQLSSRVSENTDLIDNINLTYNSATSELIYTDKRGGVQTFQLYSGSLIKKGEFDPASNSIVLTIENAGKESQITIPVSELLNDLSEKIKVNSDAIVKINEALSKLAKDWVVNNSSTIELTKTTVGDKDTLSAKVMIASGPKQAIETDANGLFVSKDFSQMTCDFGDEGEISGQLAISKLLTATTKANSDLNALTQSVDNRISSIKSDITSVENTISTLNTEVQDDKLNIINIKNDIKNNKEDIENVNEKLEKVETKVNGTETRLIAAENNITTLQGRISTSESEINAIKDTIKNDIKVQLDTMNKAIESLKSTLDTIVTPGGDLSNLLAEINKIKNVTAYDTYTNVKNMSTRLDSLETEIGSGVATELDNIKNNLIGPKDGSVEGSVWNELNNMVDAGEF